MDTLDMILLILACGTFGVAAALVVVGGYRLTLNAKLSSTGAASTSMRRAEMRSLARRNSLLFRMGEPLLRSMASVVSGMEMESLREYVRKPYGQAGYPGGLDDDEVVTLGIALGVLIAAFVAFSAVVILGFQWVWLGVLGFPMGFLGLVSNLKTRAKLREIQILQGLPYMLDLLVLLLRSGTSLRLALSRVVEDFEGHPLGVELGQVLAEIDVGAPRAECFRRFANRVKIQDIDSFADSIVQSDELGWPLADTLQRLADRISAERLLRAQTTAGQAGVLVMIPSTLVLAAAVLLLFGPLIVRFMRGDSAF